MSKPAPHKVTWFLLGREPLLSAAELFSLLNIKDPAASKYAAPFYFYSGAVAADLIERLGGTIKIGDELATGLSETGLLETMKNELQEQAGKIIFGISFYHSSASPKTVEDWGRQIKKDLKSAGHSVRYVFNKEAALSSVSVDKNDLVTKGCEFLVTMDKGKYLVARTIAIQPFESFGARDFGRPGRDSESGMLPPKLALMLYNLAGLDPSKTLLDPFCGSGTIISEALLQGHRNIIGTDLSEKAIADSKTNIAWLRANNAGIGEANLRIEPFDVKTLGENIDANSVDAIVTEPYLGKPLRGSETKEEIEAQARELLDLYSSAFQQFKKILRPGGRVVFIIPQFITRSFPVVISDKLVPMIEKFGFKVESLLPKNVFSSPFILYRRSDQRVGREIWKFVLKD